MVLKFPVELTINGDEWKIQPFRFNVHAINTGSYTPSYRDVTVTGVSPLNLPNAQANGLRNIKLYGKCEQTGTPTLDNPIPILCNNGEVGSTGYTVVGSPTISNDLVVSGFSNGNYIKTPIINWGSTFTFELPLNIGALGRSNQAYAATTGNQGLNIGITGNGKLVQRVGNGSTWVSGEIAGITTFSANDVIYIKYTYDGTAYTLYSSLDGETWTTESSYASATNVFPSGKTINIGTGRLADTGYWGGSIDLKGFKLTVDGVPVRLTETVSLNDQTAVAQDLLSCGDDYVDEQNITTGEITRNVGYLILNGTENWGIQAGYTDIFYYRTGKNSTNPNTCICTYFKGIASSYGVGILTDGDIKYGFSSQLDRVYIRYSAYADNLTGFKSWLAAKYASGQPVIVVFPKETATTESVAAQTGIQTVSGLNTLNIIQAGVDGLQMEVTYSAGVEVTIEAVQSANVDQQVEVIIGE